MIVPVKCNNKYYSSISVQKSKTKNKIEKKGNKFIIDFNINISGIINEYNCSKDLTKEKVIKDLEKKTEKKINKYIDSALKVQEESKSRFLGLKRLIYLDYPNYDNQDYDIKIKVNVNLNRKGEIRNSSKGAKNEY